MRALIRYVRTDPNTDERKRVFKRLQPGHCNICNLFVNSESTLTLGTLCCIMRRPIVKFCKESI